MVQAALQPNDEERLIDAVSQFVYDPYGFVMFAFPWGEPGGPLEHQTGPDDWQREQLMDIGKAFEDDPRSRVQEAIASGHGIGKSCQTSWIILWAMSTQPMMNGWVTANTQEQLTSKTWRELSIWHDRMINRHWFKWSATSFQHVEHGEKWQIKALTWTEHNSEAFAGTHNIPMTLLIMDEASAIADSIWTVAAGGQTDGRVMWLVFGNPTKNTGRFRECFGKYKHRWKGRQIDSRTCKMTNKELLAEWEQDWGEDSDDFRVRVRGEFPRFGTGQLISAEDVTRARENSLKSDEYVFFNIVIGVDVARYGADESVMVVRQGRKIIDWKTFSGLNNIQVGMRTAELYRKHGSVGTILVDEVGLGAGVVDYLQTAGYPCLGVNAGSKADEDKRFYNKRAEMWYRMKEWFDGSPDIPDDAILADQCAALEYSYDMKERIKLETKDRLKERLPSLGSPDRADALSITFAEIIAPGRAENSFEPDDW